MKINITPENAEHTFENAQSVVDVNGKLNSVTPLEESKITVCINTTITNKASINQMIDFNHKFQNKDLTPKDFLEEVAVKGHAFCSAILKEELGYCHKIADNFKSSWILAIDIDNTIKVKENGVDTKRKKTEEEGYYSFDDANNDPYVKENASFIYTTPTNADDHNRFRIVFILEKEIKDRSTYDKAIKSLNKMFDDDQATVSVAQGFYGSNNSEYKYFGNRFSEKMVIQLLPIEDEKTDNELKEFESEGFESSKFTKEEIREILKYIFKNGNISNDNWWKVPTILHNCFGLSENEIVELLSGITEEGDTRQKVRYAKRYSNTLGIGTLIWLAQKNGYQIPNHLRGKNYKPKFWNLTPVMDNDGNVKSIRYKTLDFGLRQFLNSNGFFNYQLDNDCRPVKIDNNIVSETNGTAIKDFTIKYIESSDCLYSDSLEKDTVLNGFSRDSKRAFSNVNEILPIVNDDNKDIFKRDQDGKSFIYYKNGFNEITKTSMSFRPYEELDGYIHSDSLTDREYCRSDNKMSVVEKFVRLLSTERLDDSKTEFDNNKFKALSSILGYLTSTFKDPSKAKAIVLTDPNLLTSDKNEGGTGKSLFANILRYVRNLTVIDGRNLNFDSDFKFNQINYNTEVCLINDCSSNFKFDNFYNGITDDLSIRQLHKGTFNIPFEKSPKFILTTNSVISDDGTSDRRRTIEIEVSNYFNQSCTPADELGRLFGSWDELEWNRFDDFIAKCVQLFLNEGLIESPPKNIDKKRFHDETCDTFVSYAENYFKEDTLYWFDSILEDYNYISDENISSHLLTKYLKAWCNYSGSNFYNEHLKNMKNRRVLVFSSKASNNMKYWKTTKEFEKLKLKTNTSPSKL